MMFRTFGVCFLLIVFMLGGCSSYKRRSELSEKLTLAVKENKISQHKMDTILKELQFIEKEAPGTAREYAKRIVSALEMGADSSHVDVLRRHIINSTKIEKDKQ